MAVAVLVPRPPRGADHIDPADVALLVEPTALDTRGVGNDQDIVDFAIENKGVVVERVQVKGSSDPTSNKLHPGDAGDVMRRLIATPVGANHLLTNRPLSTGLAEQCTPVESGESSFDRFAYHAGGLGAAGAGQFILVDNRSVDDLAASVAEHIRSIRADRLLSQSEPTARMVSMVLLHNIFRSAAGTTRARFAASDVLALLNMPDNAVAHALGSFDWN